LDGAYYHHNQGMIMTDASQPAGRFADGEFRIGHVFSQSWSVLWQHIFKIGMVTGAVALLFLLIPLALPANIGGLPLPSALLASTCQPSTLLRSLARWRFFS
jgi:hypothetical protein